MSETTSDTIARVRAANPAPIDHDLGRSPVAQATLQRILSEPAPTAQPARRLIRSRLPRGGLGVGLAVLCIGGGGAVAATNPFGWWSNNPSSARYAVDAAVHVRTPTAQQVTCHSGGAGFVCTPSGSGQRYNLIDSVQLPGRLGRINRAGFINAIALGEARHRLTSAAATILRADVASVPNSFFAEFRLAAHYATIGGASNRVPPPGVPEFLVCQDSGSTLSCQNLNGDTHAPVGAGIYGADPARDWGPGPKNGGPGYQLPPGVTFTPAEWQLLFDMTRLAGFTSGGSGNPRAVRQSKAVRVPKASGR